MSAWIVSKQHIDVLVQACYKYEIVQVMTPDKLGKLLWKENHRSVNYHYQEHTRTPRYKHDAQALCYGGHPLQQLGNVQAVARNPWIVYKLIACYDYQTCECPDYDETLAYAYVHRLEAAVLKGLGLTAESVHTRPEWHDAPWGINP